MTAPRPKSFRLASISTSLLVAFAVATGTMLAPSSALAQKPHAAAPAKAKAKKDTKKKKPKKSAAKGDKAQHGGKGGAATAPAPVAAAPAPAAKAAPSVPLELNLPIQKVALDNGLRVVMNVDHTSPTVAVAVTYDVGSRNELKGRSGFAHLFEHMMFQGSANVPKGDHFKLISGHGGVLNGTTNSDRTNYFEIVPANELALVLWLEADRMKSLDVSREKIGRASCRERG